MKVNGFVFSLLLFLSCVVLTSIFEPFRYLKYLLPMVPLLFYHNRELGVDKEILRYYSAFVVFYLALITFLFLQNIIRADISTRFVPNVVFILGPLFFVIFIIPFFDGQRIRQYVKMIFVTNILIFLYEDWQDLWAMGLNFSILRKALISSSISTENHLGFVFGFIVLYFQVEKYGKWPRIIAIILLILCFKRVVLVATLAAGISYFMLEYLRIDASRHRKSLTLFAVMVNLIFIYVVHQMVMGRFDDFFFQMTNRSTNHFLMGRQALFAEAFDKVGVVNWPGIGIGQMDEIIANFYGAKMNLHSEILKNYFEFGVVLFVFWIWLILQKTLFSNKAAVFVLYLNLLMLTDNVFIYFDVMFYFYFFILIFLFEARMKKGQVVRVT